MSIDFAAILDQAYTTAHAACRDLPDTGACGFAWVVVPGNSPLARYCRKEIARQGERMEWQRYYGSKSIRTGWQFWNPGRYVGQDVDASEAGAKAFVAVLRQHGIDAHANSRLD